MINVVQSFTKEELEVIFDLVSFEYHASDFEYQNRQYKQTITDLYKKFQISLENFKSLGEPKC